ncbi:MAG: sodium-dependent transporter [Lachnospirales bacterium]
MSKMKKNDFFKSQLGVVLAAAGSAVGLGNLWAFPYKAGANGGGIFILMYLFFALCLGLPVMISEFIIGKNASNSSSIRMFDRIPTENEKRPVFFKSIGILGCISSIMVASFYAIIAGWSFEYLLMGITEGYSAFAQGPEYASVYFGSLVTNFELSTIYGVTFIVLTLCISFFGINAGIEKMSKVLMPLLVVILILLLVNGVLSGGFAKTVNFLIFPSLTSFDGTKVNIASAALTAMSQAFFSLSLGMAGMITYGSYMPKESNVISTSLKIVTFDTLVAFLAGFAIFPIVFAQGLDPAQGTGLVFNSLTVCFANLKLGRLLGILTFSLLLIAAITSLVSMLETVISAVIGGTKIERKGVVVVIGLFVILGSVLCQPALGLSASFLEFAADNLMDQFDQLTMNMFIPFTSLLTVLFVGFRIRKDLVISEFRSQSLGNKFYFYIRFVLPIILCFVMFIGLKDLFT